MTQHLDTLDRSLSVAHTQRRAWTRLPSGGRLDLITPDPYAWTDKDLAVKLSRTFRWGGESVWPAPMSVAQHSLQVLELVREWAGRPLTPSEQLRELLHDAEEAFLGFDCIAPLKQTLGREFAAASSRLTAAIEARYGMGTWSAEDYSLHKAADTAAAASEAVHVVGWSTDEVRDVLDIVAPILAEDPLVAIYGGRGWEPWPCDVAAERFMAKLTELQLLARCQERHVPASAGVAGSAAKSGECRDRPKEREAFEAAGLEVAWGVTLVQNIAGALLCFATRFHEATGSGLQMLDILRTDPDEVAPETWRAKVAFNWDQVCVWCQAFGEAWRGAPHRHPNSAGRSGVRESTSGRSREGYRAAAGEESRPDLDQTNAAYINHGGIGFVTGAGADYEICIPAAARHRSLRLVSAFDARLLREVAAPEGGWTHSALVQALEVERAIILSFAPVYALLGDEYIGSTET